MKKSLVQYLFPEMSTVSSQRTIGDLIHDVDIAISNEETVWNMLTDPILIDSSILRIASLKKKRESLHHEAVREFRKLS